MTEDKTGDKADAQDPADGNTGSDDLAKVRREAAGHRRKRRGVEAERDKLAALLSDTQRAEIERQVTGDGGLQSAADFWTAGVKLDELRDEEGGIDAEKVKAAQDRVSPSIPIGGSRRRTSTAAPGRPRLGTRLRASERR